MHHLPFLLALVFMIAPALAADEPQFLPAHEMRPRGTLPNVAARLRAGQDVRIAYFGGSITASNGWRVMTTRWLREQFPSAHITEINASIAGTGSQFGVFRLGEHVLAHKPDLLFVEFAVNDTGIPQREIRRCMEGIVRQTWSANPSTDICFVYTMQERFMPYLSKSDFSPSASAMEVVAEHYGIPSVHLAHEVVQLLNENKLVITAPKGQGKTTPDGKMVFSNDGIHPLVETGHRIYADAATRALATLLSGDRVPHNLPDPLERDHLAAARMVPLEQVTLSGGWTKVPDDHEAARQTGLRELWHAREPGESIRFRFRGTCVGLYDVVSPDAGHLAVSVDGGPATLHSRLNTFSPHYRGKGVILLSDLPMGEHTVEITISPEPVDRRSVYGQRFGWGETNEQKYPAPAHYVLRIMIDGELLPSD